MLNWVSYVVTALVALTFSALSSGCRFGNRVENKAPVRTTNGYYELVPTAQRICAAIGGADQCVNQTGTFEIPDGWSLALTNPAIFVMQDQSKITGAAVIASTIDTKYGLNVEVISQGNFKFGPKTSVEQLWVDEACTIVRAVQATGTHQMLAAQKRVGDFLINGKLTLGLEMASYLEGDCSATLVDLNACYTDETKCKGDTTEQNKNTQAAVQDFFKLYIDAGVMTVNDIPAFQGFYYKTEYL